MMEQPCAPMGTERSREPKDFFLPNYPLLVISNVDDAGISTGGSLTTLQDLTQYWAPHMWQGALLILSIEDTPYFTFVTDNTEQQLTFPQFPSKVQISQNRYAIKSFGASPPSVTKIATRILNLAALAAATTSILANCAAIDMTFGVSSLAITVGCTYNPAAVAGIRIHVRTSYDGVNYDTVDWDAWNPGFVAGGTIQQTKVYDTSPAYIKVLIENLDAAQTVTLLTVESTVRGG